MTTQTFWLMLILEAPLIAAGVLALWPRRLNRAAHWIAGVGALLALVGIVALLPALQHHEEPALALAWAPAMGIEFDLHLDWLAFPFLLTEGVVALVAILYAWGYHPPDERASYFYALLLIFSLGMAGTTLADDLVLFYIFWELMLIASCALIFVWGEGARRGAVALKYFIFTHLGSLLVLVGLVMLYDAAGTDRFSALRAGVTLPPAQVTGVIALFLIGFCVKMAVFPLHLWLPDAHTVAPMPVTIMLAAAMLSLGAYGILRFPMSLFSREALLPFMVPMMAAGVISEIYGALMALAEQDIKRVVAYSSVSQMGYVLFGLGTLTQNGVAGATLQVIYHGIVKALLFMVIGLVIYATGKRQLKDLGGLAKALPITTACAGIGALAIAGVPPFCLFDSEWMIFSGAFETPYTLLAVATVLGSLLTVAYALWLMAQVFLGERPADLDVEPEKQFPLAMLAPTGALAALALIAGLVPGPVFNWVMQELPLLMGGTW